jgi:hypothetical protein
MSEPEPYRLPESARLALPEADNPILTGAAPLNPLRTLSGSVWRSPFLTTRELAIELKVREQTVRRWRWSGGGPRYIAGRRCLYDIRDVELWLEGRKRSSTSEAP